MSQQPSKAPRSWWQNEFYDHPAQAQKLNDAYLITTGGTRVEKVYCRACFEADVNETLAREEKDRDLGRINDVRSREDVIKHCKY